MSNSMMHSTSWVALVTWISFLTGNGTLMQEIVDEYFSFNLYFVIELTIGFSLITDESTLGP